MKALVKRINNPHLLIALALAFVFHGSLLFAGSYIGAVFFVIPTVVSVVADKFRTPLSDEPSHSVPGRSLNDTFSICWRYLQRVLPVLLRSGLYLGHLA